MQGSETYDPLSGQEDGDGQTVWSDTSRLYPKKNPTQSEKLEWQISDYCGKSAHAHLSFLSSRSSWCGCEPRDCNVKCLYPYRAASVSVAFILSVVSAVVSPPISPISQRRSYWLREPLRPEWETQAAQRNPSLSFASILAVAMTTEDFRWARDARGYLMLFRSERLCAYVIEEQVRNSRVTIQSSHRLRVCVKCR